MGPPENSDAPTANRGVAKTTDLDRSLVSVPPDGTAATETDPLSSDFEFLGACFTEPCLIPDAREAIGGTPDKLASLETEKAWQALCQLQRDEKEVTASALAAITGDAGTAERVATAARHVGDARLTMLHCAADIAARVSEEWAPETNPNHVLLPSVPWTALPHELGAYGRAVAANMESPESLVFGAMLATASACVPTGARILGRHGYAEIGALWFAMLAMPGSKKTPTISRVTLPLNDYDAGLQSAHAVAQESWRKDCAVLQAQSKRGAKPLLPPEPRRVQAIVDDATVESLGDLLAANESIDLGLLCAPDELSGLTGGMNQYKGGKGSDRAAYLKLWAGQAVRVNRRGRFVYVKRPRMALIGGIQPAVACKLQAFDESDGLLDRLHWIDCRDEAAPRFDVPPVPPALEHAWNKMLRALLPVVTPAELCPKIAGDGPPTDVDARLFELAPDARERYGDFYESCDRRDLPPLLRGYAGKLAGQCLRVALTLHHLKHGRDVFNQSHVDGETMRGAIAVTQWLAAHTYHVRTFMAGGVTAGDDARRVLKWIAEQGGCVTLRDLTRIGPTFARNAARAAEILAELARAGHGDFEDAKTSSGREKRVFRLADR